MPGPDAVEARYAPGAGVLLGGGARWLLIDLPDLAAADDARLERLWELVTGPATAPARVLAVVAQEVGECSLVLADLTPAAPTVLTRGSGRAEATEHGQVLRLGDGPRAVHPTDRLGRRRRRGGRAADQPGPRPRRPRCRAGARG